MRPPIWGSFIFYADYDVLAFALLFQGGLHVASYYHATQAIEKYLKALALSIVDPPGRTHPYPQNKRWLQDHNLVRIANRCTNSFPYYGLAPVQTILRKFSEFDQTTRYPWVEQNEANGFTSADIPMMCDLLLHLRNDLPITVDDYPLGIFIRGYHHNHPEIAVNAVLMSIQSPAVSAARAVIPQLKQMIRR